MCHITLDVPGVEIENEEVEGQGEVTGSSHITLPLQKSLGIEGPRPGRADVDL